MKALIKKIFILFLLVIAYNSASAEIRFFSGWVSKDGKIYRVANVNVYFENTVTKQKYRTETNYWGQYSLALEEGQYEVKAVLPGSQLVFKSVFNIPSSDGIIRLNTFYSFSGQLHSTEAASSFDGYAIQVNRKTDNGEQVSYNLKVENSGIFSANLQVGVYECLIFDNKGKLSIETEITIKKEKTMDFMVMSEESTSLPSTIINDNNTPTKSSKNQKNTIEHGTPLVAGINNDGLYNLIFVIIISIVILIVYYKPVIVVKEGLTIKTPSGHSPTIRIQKTI
jgi:uncharacterized integral membrane protein